MRCIRLSSVLWALGAMVMTAAELMQPVAAQAPTRGPSLAQVGGGTVTDIRVEGVQRIEPETVRSYLLIQPGDAWDDEQVDRSLKALFATGRT